MSGRLPAKVQARRFYRGILPSVLLLLSGAIAFLGFLTYRIIHPAAALESVNPSHFLLPSVDVAWKAKDNSTIAGWWIPGNEGAAAVILAPGYGMSRSEVLTLASALHTAGFNVLTYDTRGSGANPRGACTLGISESDDMLTAIDFLRTRPPVPSDRVGVWGVDVNARAALKTAISRPEVRAIVVDSAFESVKDFMNLRIHEDFGWDSRVIQIGCLGMFRAYTLTSSASIGEVLGVERLANRNILFLEGENRPELGRLTTGLYDRIRPQKELLTLTAARARMMGGEDTKNYDRQVANFFQLNLRQFD